MLWIDVCIPYEPGKKLAFAYNRAMKNSKSEWVLIIDHDLFFVNPHWYDMCLNAIERVGNKAGLITAKCNRIGPTTQLYKPQKDTDNIKDHIKIAREVYFKYGNRISFVKQTPGSYLSGFFMLTSKTAWKKVGGFRDMGKGLSKIDADYSKRLKEVGYGLYVIEGLYFYHLYKYKWKTVWDKNKWKLKGRSG